MYLVLKNFEGYLPHDSLREKKKEIYLNIKSSRLMELIHMFTWCKFIVIAMKIYTIAVETTAVNGSWSMSVAFGGILPGDSEQKTILSLFCE